MNDEIDETTGVSRRDMLRKTAIVGGALVWTAPAVQSLAGPAFAQTSGSPGGQEACVYYAVSLTITGSTGGFTCADIAGSSASGSTDCVSNPPPSASNFPAAIPGGCDLVTGVTQGPADAQGNRNWVVMLAPEVDANSVQGFSKCSNDSCQPVSSSTNGPTSDTLVFTPCIASGPNGQNQAISNVQIVFCRPRTV